MIKTGRKRRMKKQLAKIAVLSAVFCGVSAATAFAGGWNVDHVGRWYQNDDGTYPKNGWAWIDILF